MESGVTRGRPTRRHVQARDPPRAWSNDLPGAHRNHGRPRSQSPQTDRIRRVALGFRSSLTYSGSRWRNTWRLPRSYFLERRLGDLAPRSVVERAVTARNADGRRPRRQLRARWIAGPWRVWRY